jgi:hypothetical protein
MTFVSCSCGNAAPDCCESNLLDYLRTQRLWLRTLERARQCQATSRQLELHLTSGATTQHRTQNYITMVEFIDELVFQPFDPVNIMASIGSHLAALSLPPTNKQAHFRFMDLPTEVRLIVYDNWDAETRRSLPYHDGQFFYQTFDRSLLQVSSNIRSEAMKIIQRRRPFLKQCFTFPLRHEDDSTVNPFNALRLLCQAYHLDVEGLKIPDINTTKQLENFKEKLRLRWTNQSPTASRAESLALYDKTLSQLRKEPVLKIRLLVSVEEHVTNILSSDKQTFWSLVGRFAPQFPTELKIRFVLVVKPEDRERCETLTAQPGILPRWLDEDMWKIEVSGGGLDPAVD